MDAEFGHTVRFHLGAGARGLRRLLFKRGGDFDVLFVSRPLPMKALRRARWRGSLRRPAIIYDAEAVVSPRERQQRALFGIAWTTRQYELSVAAEMQMASGAHAVTAVSQFDAQMISSTLGVPVFLLPHTTSIRTGAPGPKGRKDLLFFGRLTGAAHTSPNVDSVSWFVRTVMPNLDQLLGDGYRLHVVGLVEAPEITALSSERVVLHGLVDDLEPLYDSCRLFVAPTRYSAGIPLKLIEAMSQAIPCVAKSELARQLDAPSDALMTADSPSNFAAACAQLYGDDTKWRMHQAQGLAFVSQFASAEAFDHALLAAINAAVAEARLQDSRDDRPLIGSVDRATD